MRECLTCGARPGVKTGSEAIDDGDWNQFRDPAPFLPAMKAAQVVRAHDPDEAHARAVAAQVGNGLVGVAGSDLRLEVGDVDARMARERARGTDALGQRRKAARVLERVARRYQPPHAIEA